MNQSLSHTKELQQRYWTDFRVYLVDSGSKLDPYGKPLPLSWHAFRLKRSNERIEAVITANGETRVELYLTGNEASAKFSRLKRLHEQELIELFGEVFWSDDGCKRKKVYLRHVASLTDKNKWPHQFLWLATHIQAMYDFFKEKL